MKPTEKTNKNTAVKKRSGNKFIKPIVITAVVLAVLIAAVIIVPKVIGGKETSTKITTYNVNKVTYGNITQTISGSGTLTPVTSETLTSTKGGENEKVNFTVGDEVKEDDVIAVVNGESIKAPCEACILSVLGGIVGLALSFGVVEVYKAISSSAVSLNWGVGFAAIAFCAVIGVLFGVYPAAKASRLQPIDALHTT